MSLRKKKTGKFMSSGGNYVIRAESAQMDDERAGMIQSRHRGMKRSCMSNTWSRSHLGVYDSCGRLC